MRRNQCFFADLGRYVCPRVCVICFVLPLLLRSPFGQQQKKKTGLVACGALKSIATATGFCPAVCVLVCLCGSASRGRIIIILPCPQRFLLPSHITRTVYVVLRSSLPCPALPDRVPFLGQARKLCKTVAKRAVPTVCCSHRPFRFGAAVTNDARTNKHGIDTLTGVCVCVGRWTCLRAALWLAGWRLHDLFFLLLLLLCPIPCPWPC